RDVTMNDAAWPTCTIRLAMSIVERFGRLDRDIDSDADGDLAIRVLRGAQQRRQIDPVDILHRDIQRPAEPPEIEHLHDIRVRELDGDLRLFDEALDELLLLRELRQDPLYGEHLLESMRAE